MQVPFMNLKLQHKMLDVEINAALSKCIKQCAFIQGKHVALFESQFSEFLNCPHVIGCSSGTSALFLALNALGIKQDDEVITAANTFIATSEAISMTGAKVIFADVDEITGNISVETLRGLITKKTKAIVAVHLHGFPCDLANLKTFANNKNINLVADAAQAHGAMIDNVDIASLADITTYSFYPGKNLGAMGDAGAIATPHKHLSDYISKSRNHGRTQKYIHDFEGYNMRMDELQAAILSVKLKYLNEWNQKRRNLAEYYIKHLSGIGDIKLPPQKENIYSVYHLFVIETTQRDNLKDYLGEHNIATGIHYPITLPEQPAYSHLRLSATDIPIAHKKSKRILSLPIFPEMTENEQNYVIDTVKAFYCN